MRSMNLYAVSMCQIQFEPLLAVPNHVTISMILQPFHHVVLIATTEVTRESKFTINEQI